MRSPALRAGSLTQDENGLFTLSQRDPLGKQVPMFLPKASLRDYRGASGEAIPSGEGSISKVAHYQICRADGIWNRCYNKRGNFFKLLHTEFAPLSVLGDPYLFAGAFKQVNRVLLLTIPPFTQAEVGENESD